MSEVLWTSRRGGWRIEKTDFGNKVRMTNGRVSGTLSIDVYGDFEENGTAKVPKYVMDEARRILDQRHKDFWTEEESPFYLPDQKDIRPCPRCRSTDVEFVCDEVQTDIDRFEPRPPGFIVCYDCRLATSESEDTDAVLKEWNTTVQKYVLDADTGRIVPRVNRPTVAKAAWSRPRSDSRRSRR